MNDAGEPAKPRDATVLRINSAYSDQSERLANLRANLQHPAEWNGDIPWNQVEATFSTKVSLAHVPCAICQSMVLPRVALHVGHVSLRTVQAHLHPPPKLRSIKKPAVPLETVYVAAVIDEEGHPGAAWMHTPAGPPRRPYAHPRAVQTTSSQGSALTPRVRPSTCRSLLGSATSLRREG